MNNFKNMFSENTRLKYFIASLFVLACLFTAVFLLCGKSGKAYASSEYTINAVRDYTVCTDAAAAITEGINDFALFSTGSSFVFDENLSETSKYEALYISQNIRPMEYFTDMPVLLDLKEALYPFVCSRYVLIIECSDPDSVPARAVTAVRNSDFGKELFGSDNSGLKIGISAVYSSGRLYIAIHLSDTETANLLPEITVIHTQTQKVKEYSENGDPDTTEEPDTVLPYIYGDSVALPVTGDEEFYDVAAYVSAYDDSGSVSIYTLPAFVGPGFEGTVNIEAEDLSGNMASASLPVSFGEMQNIRLAESDDIFCEGISSDGSGSISCGNQVVLRLKNSGEGNIYKFTFYRNGEAVYSFLRAENYTVWNPRTSGNYTVTVSIISNDNFSCENAGTLNFTVSDRILTPYSPVTFSFIQDSSLRIDEKGYLSGLTEGMTYNGLLANIVFEKENPDAEITVSVTGSDGGSIDSLENIIGTGAEIVLSCEGVEFMRVTAVLYGDITGDGVIDISDFAKLRYAILKKITLEGSILEAANVAAREDGEVDISDFAMLRYKLLGKIEITQ